MKNVISHVIGILELVLLTKLPLAQSSLARLGFDVLRNEFGLFGRLLAENEYSYETIFDKYQNLFHLNS